MMTNAHQGIARSRGAGRGRRRRSGQILVLTVLAITMLVALIFHVYNVGDQINRRIDMQNVADSTAVSGAGWMARSMNVVAMNNVSQSRMIALVPVIDAVSLSSEMAYRETKSWSDGLDKIVTDLRGEGAVSSQSRNKILEGLAALQVRLQSQSDLLEPMQTPEMQNEIERATTWTVRGVGGAPPHGSLWRSTISLGQFSEATFNSAPLLAQATATRFAGENGASAGFVAPVIPEIPAYKGTLADFSTVLQKRLKVDLLKGSVKVDNGDGGAVSDAAWPHRLGPWARLFIDPMRWNHSGDHWRIVSGQWQFVEGRWWYGYRRRNQNRGWREIDYGRWVYTGGDLTIVIPPREGHKISGPSAGGGRAGSGAGRGHGAEEGRTVTRRGGGTREVQGYTTFGPYWWANDAVAGYASSSLPDTRFREYYEQIAATKLNYVFGPVDPELEELHTPQWFTDLEEARSIAADSNFRTTRTRYYYMEVISKEPDDHAGWANSITSDNLGDPVTRDFNGWVAPESLKQRVFGINLQITGPEQLGTLPIWKFTSTGTEQILNPDGSVKEEWPVYFTWFFVFGGLDAGGDVQISNPANWDQFDVLPAPILLDVNRADYTEDPDEGARREYFSYLSVVRKLSPSAVWGQKFSPGNPTDGMFTIAQAKLFNNTSWDLWTQDWQVQLTGVRDWDNWCRVLERGQSEAALTEGFVPSDEVSRAHAYMTAFPAQMADSYVNH